MAYIFLYLKSTTIQSSFYLLCNFLYIKNPIKPFNKLMSFLRDCTASHKILSTPVKAGSINRKKCQPIYYHCTISKLPVEGTLNVNVTALPNFHGQNWQNFQLGFYLTQQLNLWAWRQLNLKVCILMVSGC